jgi:hypothetical protein
MIKKIFFILFLFISSFHLASANENIITSDTKQIINLSNVSEKTRDLINNKSLVFEASSWVVNCDEKKCLLDTTWIYKWDIKLNMKLENKILKTEYYSINKLGQIANSIFVRWDRTIKKDLEAIYSYAKLDQSAKEYIKNWEIFIVSNKWELKCQNEVCFINTKNINFWDISIKIKSGNRTLKDYSFKIKKFADNLDISYKFKYKSIQKYDLSCEISAASDIMSAILWKKIEEDELIEKMDKSSFYWKKPIAYKWQRLWWDPNDWFVWKIDNAHQNDYTWYWVLEKPILKLYYKYSIMRKAITNSNYTNSYKQNEHLRELFMELHKWNFVQLWWDYLTNPAEEDWKSSKKITVEQANMWLNGKNYAKTWNKDRRIYWNYMKDAKLYEHVWLNWEHAFYLLGYEWSIENPSKVIVWDTQTGKHKYSLKEWMRKWNLMQNRSLIIEWN